MDVNDQSESEDVRETSEMDTGEQDIEVDASSMQEIETGDERIDVDSEIETDSQPGERDASAEREAIEQSSDYSPEVNGYIRSEAELGVYQRADLHEAEIGDKTALIRDDINWDQVDEKGRTNSKRIEEGLSPLDSEGDAIELHHVGQKQDSPLAELTFEEHRGKGNDTILHDKSIESETHGEGNDWANERRSYWKDRHEFNQKEKNNG